MENEEKLKIGVVVPCTRADTIARCLDSLLKQSRYADEIIVVQANDKDIQRALDSFQQEKGVNIKRVFAPGPGVVKALNAGIRNCATDIICFIDDDACAKEDWIKLIEGHYKDHNVAGVGGRDILHCQGKIFQKRVKNVGKISWYGKIVGNHHNITNVVKSVDFLKGCNTSYRRESIPPLDENLGLGRETRTDPHWEIDIGLLIKKSGRKILFDPHIMVDHYKYTCSGVA